MTTTTLYTEQELRRYQQLCVADAVRFVETQPPGSVRLYTAPTGTGKGTIELVVRDTLTKALGKAALIVTPSLEVIRGYLERSGINPGNMTPDKLADAGLSIGVTTPVRFRNALLKAEFSPLPDVVLLDEAHHNVSSNIVTADLKAMLPAAVWLGFTATGYRGTSRGTKDLRAEWGEPVEVLNLVQAVELGAMQAPIAKVVPLLDDDTVKIVNGEFQVKSSNKELTARVRDLAELVASFGSVTEEGDWPHFSKPTMVAVPSTEIAHGLVQELKRLDVCGWAVLQDTPAHARALIYEDCRTGGGVIVQISVVSEGVDFPWLKRIIDAKPTMSPVAWLQLVGRECRPGGEQPEYICTNRNLERHSYLFDGALPRKVTADAQKAFDGPTKRSGARFLGLEGLGKFKAIEVPLRDGSTGTLYILIRQAGGMAMEEFACLVVPGKADSICATRRNVKGAGNVIEWGVWRPAELPDEMTGFGTSKQTGKLSEKQRAWWLRDAERRGLDPLAADDISRRQFAVLPILTNLKTKVVL